MRALHLLLEAILVIVTILFVLEYKDRIIKRLLQKEEIAADIKFVDLHCIQARNIHYKKQPVAKKALACIRYTPLLQGKIELSQVVIRGLNLNSIQRLSSSSSSSGTQNSFALPLLIQKLHIEAKYRYKGLNKATLIAKDVTPQKAKITKLYVQSFAGNIKAKGKYDGVLTLSGEFYPNPNFVKKELPSINPKAVKKAVFTLTANEKSLTYTLSTKATRLLYDLNATLKSKGSYRYASKRYFSQNRFNIDYNKTRISSDVNVTYQNILTYTASGTIKNESYNLPIKHSFYEQIAFFLKGDLHTLQGRLNTPHFNAKINAKEYKSFEIETDPIYLGTLIDLPKELQKRKITLQAHYDGALEAKLGGDLGQALVTYQKNKIEILLNPKDFATLHLSRLSPVKIKADLNAKKASLSSPIFTAKAKFANGVDAIVHIGKSKAHLLYDSNLTLDATIPSLRALAKQLSAIYPLDLEEIEAKLHIYATYNPKSEHFFYHLHSPKVSKGLKRLKYFEIKGHGVRKSLWIDYYAIAFDNHAFYATKPSKIVFDNGITIKKFWIEDSLLLQGSYTDEHGYFTLKSDRYHYSSIEGSVDVNVNLSAAIEKRKVNVEGKLLLLQGDLSFEPKRTKNVEDPDIIVVDAPKKEAPPFFKENVAFNVKIDAKKAIRYHISDLELFFKPDLLAWKEFGKDLELLGYVNILKGSYTPLGEEYFITKSNLYFYSKPTNPFLELHIKTKKESYTIYITVSGSLSTPILTFDSDPYLPQKDILTLLLLGSKSSNLLFKAVGGSQLAGALSSMFLKNVLSTFGIKLDTLTFSAGSRLGFEVGKRISDKITVLYKNDQVSTIIIRYQMGDHFESEAIFGPQRSGINIFYRKVR